MKTLLLAAALVACAIVATPAAVACPDPDNPCDPPPMGLCHGTEPDPLKAPVAWAKWVAGCL
ncbi:MAG TPA: hypothetical protein VHH36_02350 [Candidatus Thermoplasmatota archaeon]|nr:hypothetical protein [Candidatus Thermoplasmatota archaeon]